MKRRELFPTLKFLSKGAGKSITMFCVYYKEALDNVRHNKLIKKNGVDSHDIISITNLYWYQTFSIRIEGEDPEDVEIKQDVCQSCVM